MSPSFQNGLGLKLGRILLQVNMHGLNSVMTHYQVTTRVQRLCCEVPNIAVLVNDSLLLSKLNLKSLILFSIGRQMVKRNVVLFHE